MYASAGAAAERTCSPRRSFISSGDKSCDWNCEARQRSVTTRRSLPNIPVTVNAAAGAEAAAGDLDSSDDAHEFSQLDWALAGN